MKIAVFGSSGQAREVVDICESTGYTSIVLIDRVPGTEPVSGLPIVGENATEELVADGYSFFIGIGDNCTRKKVFGRFPHLPYVNLVHPSASFGRGQRMVLEQRKGNLVAAGVRFTNNITLGDFGIFNLNCTVSHDVILGDFVDISLGARVAGNVRIGEGAFICAGATIVNGRSLDDKITVGAYATVGAGAVVIDDIPAGRTVTGIPARV